MRLRAILVITADSRVKMRFLLREVAVLQILNLGLARVISFATVKIDL